MIYSNTALYESSAEFEFLLEKTRALVLNSFDINKINTGNKFEDFVFEKINMAAIGSIFEGCLYQTKDRDFPDIIANKYWGVEVKFTKEDKWKSIGNSVLESSRVEGVEKIYLFFGKCGGYPEIKYRLYEECLSGISVTHYPRYEIDMNLQIGESIFAKMNTSYDELRKASKPIKKIRQFYKSKLKENDSLWWIDDNEDVKPPQIISFNNLSKEHRQKLIAEGFILFPHILSSEQDKYARLCSFWVTYYSVICPNMRDQYSAGGTIHFFKCSHDEQQLAKKCQLSEINRIGYNLLFCYADIIKDLFPTMNLDIVSECWGEEIYSYDQFYNSWKQKIDFYTQKQHFLIPLSSMFEKVLE